MPAIEAVARFKVLKKDLPSNDGWITTLFIRAWRKELCIEHVQGGLDQAST